MFNGVHHLCSTVVVLVFFVRFLIVHYLPLPLMFNAINFGDNIFGGINFGEISTIHQISLEIGSLEIFGVENFRLGTSSPKLFHAETYRK